MIFNINAIYGLSFLKDCKMDMKGNLRRLKASSHLVWCYWSTLLECYKVVFTLEWNKVELFCEVGFISQLRAFTREVRKHLSCVCNFFYIYIQDLIVSSRIIALWKLEVTILASIIVSTPSMTTCLLESVILATFIYECTIMLISNFWKTSLFYNVPSKPKVDKSDLQILIYRLSKHLLTTTCLLLFQ